MRQATRNWHIFKIGTFITTFVSCIIRIVVIHLQDILYICPMSSLYEAKNWYLLHVTLALLNLSVQLCHDRQHNTLRMQQTTGALASYQSRLSKTVYHCRHYGIFVMQSTLFWARDCFPILGFKLIHVSKKGSCNACNSCHVSVVCTYGCLCLSRWYIRCTNMVEPALCSTAFIQNSI